ncbi:hypothetical protein SAMN05428984_1827 [Sphingomonas sp. OK281]|nr:hypothetical protein SAMN05428984_1827 [Sphingomonas sp. OK281]
MTPQVLVPVLLLATLSIWAWRKQRRLTRLKRYGRRSQPIYVRTRRDGWFKSLLSGKGSKRMSERVHQRVQTRTDQTL